MNNNMKTSISKAFAFLFSIVLYTTVSAQNSNTTPALEIKYAGTQGNYLLFDVAYNNEGAAPFTFDVTDADEFVFYSEKFKDRSFTKRFAVNRMGLTNTIVFEVLSASGNKRQVFTVNGTIKMVEERFTAKL